MTGAAKLLLTADEFSQVAALADGRGRAKVDRGLLSKIVVDHTRALQALQRAGVAIDQGTAQAAAAHV